MDENTLLDSLRSLFNRHDPSVHIGSGPDDCAHVRAKGHELAASTDAFAENSHFTADHSPEQIAYKTLAASLSDLAGSGCYPRWAMVTLCLRPGLPDDWPDRFAKAMAKTADAFGVSIIGGDTIAAQGGIVVTTTVIGEPLPGGPVLRSGAKPGDVVVVTGALGGSLLGKHMEPTPRLAEMRYLMEQCQQMHVRPSAAMDISDGLALDLSRLCKESGVGAVINAALIPLAPAAEKRAETSGGTALDHALGDGEDFELLLTLPPEAWEHFRKKPVPHGLAPFTKIGSITQESGIALQISEGETIPLAPQGYQHQW